MKTLLTGVVCFLVGAASSPKAANENETLALLCHRFTSEVDTKELRITAVVTHAVVASGQLKSPAVTEQLAAVSASMLALERVFCADVRPAAAPRAATKELRLEKGWGPRDRDSMLAPSF
jgi:hypothetical protein